MNLTAITKKEWRNYRICACEGNEVEEDRNLHQREEKRDREREEIGETLRREMEEEEEEEEEEDENEDEEAEEEGEDEEAEEEDSPSGNCAAEVEMVGPMDWKVDGFHVTPFSDSIESLVESRRGNSSFKGGEEEK